MLKAQYVSNCLVNNLDEIKIAALYYDEIEILNNIVYMIDMDRKMPDRGRIRSVHPCIDEQFKSDLTILESEKIIKYRNSEDCSLVPINTHNSMPHPKLLIEMMQQASKLIFEAKENILIEETIDPKTTQMQIGVEAIEVYSSFKNKLGIDSLFEPDFIYKYYRNLLTYLLFGIATGGNILTSSTILNQYITRQYLPRLLKESPNDYNAYKLAQPNIAMEAIRIHLPNVSRLSFEDILELRFKMKDELQSFRYCIQDLNKQMNTKFETEEIIRNPAFYIGATLNPAVDELSGKIKGVKLGIGGKIIDEIKNPLSYAPFLGNVFFNLPSHLTLLLSLGLISAKAAVDYIKEMTQLKQNGLYFLIKLRDSR